VVPSWIDYCGGGVFKPSVSLLFIPRRMTLIVSAAARRSGFAFGRKGHQASKLMPNLNQILIEDPPALQVLALAQAKMQAAR
jgi:ribosomal protein S3